MRTVKYARMGNYKGPTSLVNCHAASGDSRSFSPHTNCFGHKDRGLTENSEYGFAEAVESAGKLGRDHILVGGGIASWRGKSPRWRKTGLAETAPH